jgi:hypothetical protein
MRNLPARGTGPNRPTAIRAGLVASAALVLSIAGLITTSRPVLADCNENTKFVEQVAGTNLYFGISDAVINYDHRPMCSVNAHSTFMRMSDDYFSWLEIGIREDPNGTTHFWSEWKSYPNPTVVTYYDSQFGHPGFNQWFSFEIQNEGSGLFSLWWQPGSNPYANNWSFLGMSAAMSRNVGEVESEEARFGDANASHLAFQLSTQNRLHYGWTPWTNLQCDQSQNGITDWVAEKKSNSYWNMNQNVSGLC